MERIFNILTRLWQASLADMLARLFTEEWGVEKKAKSRRARFKPGALSEN
jgi:hypothetical protein